MKSIWINTLAISLAILKSLLLNAFLDVISSGDCFFNVPKVHNAMMQMWSNCLTTCVGFD